MFTIVGGSGFLGRNLAAHLRTRKEVVNVIEERAAPLPGEMLGHVLYCAGRTSDFAASPGEMVRGHVGLLGEILERNRFDSLLYLSSTRLYGRGSRGDEDALLTVDVNDPDQLYCAAKLLGESLALATENPAVRVARISYVVGPNTRASHFLYALIRQALEGRIVLRDDPRTQRDYIDLDDVVQLLPRIALTGRDRIYNVAGGTAIANGEIAERLSALTGCVVADGPSGVFRPQPAIDTSRIRRDFAFVPRPPLERLPAVVDAFRAVAGIVA